MTGDGTPGTLSIVVPVYNTGKLLLESVDSVLRQDMLKTLPHDRWELLLCDDRSTDPETLAALAEAQRLSPNVRVLRSERRKGAAGARNTGIFHSRAEWIAFLDSDDIWYEDALSRRFEAVASCPDAGWISGHFFVMDPDGTLHQKPVSERSPRLYQIIKVDYDRARPTLLARPVPMLLGCGCFGIMTCLVRRSLLRAVDGFDETLPTAEDYDLWLRVAELNDVCIVPYDLGIYRRREGSLTKSGRPMYFGEDRMIGKALAKDGFAPYRADLEARLRLVYASHCYFYRANKMRGRALLYAFRFLRIASLSIAPWKHMLAALLGR